MRQQAVVAHVLLLENVRVCAYVRAYAVIDNCASGPCKYGSTCTSGVNTYSCACAAGFMGTNCDTGKHVAMCVILQMTFDL